MSSARRESGGRAPVAVDLGCGRQAVPGSFGLDAVALPGVQIVARIDARRLPFVTGSIDSVFALNVLEHLDDLPSVMLEIARVLRRGGICRIEVPYFASVSANSDPTHRRHFTYTTFEHFAPSELRGWRAGRHNWFGEAAFRLSWRELQFGMAHRLAGVSLFANRLPALYENLFVYWFPARALQVKLVRMG